MTKSSIPTTSKMYPTYLTQKIEAISISTKVKRKVWPVRVKGPHRITLNTRALSEYLNDL